MRSETDFLAKAETIRFFPVLYLPTIKIVVCFVAPIIITDINYLIMKRTK
jgi:hypothetical protein